jgi:hypothetical protein
MEGPDRPYGIPFFLASKQILQFQRGFGIDVTPPVPKNSTYNFVFILFEVVI